ncbi:peptide-methionine (R)-S-oxide reductase MsrB [Neorhizobium sp. NCHU2750]|uniref:peptide-methionine (R)-S-oxide reductase MsrB n=1 Tax=Neorhizobium sp. NCHU2750 TaxID=1825976 RepID=UPI000E772410|nr:peptide-methionine (R)-S-oxide reductase [Neorhizobium sp. NCHU2750]
MSSPTMPKVSKSDAEWREELSPEQYYILRQAGTERAFTGPFWNAKEKGIYSCAGCGEDLFVSDTKFDSGCGWPSYFEPVKPDVVTEIRDTSHGMVRTEVRCAHCGGHLGHVFPDGPPPTGLRYCINGHAMNFRAAE